MKIRQFLLWIARVVNYDFCPQLSGVDGLLKHPLGWVISAIVASLLVGLFIGPQGYVLAFSFLALLVFGLAWPWLSMKGVRCHLIMPDRRVEENQELEMVFSVKNYWPLPVYGLMVKGEFLQESEVGEPVVFSLKRVGAWSESKFRILITPRRRGKLPTGKVTIASGFPFGLKDISKPVDALQPTVVWPACVPLDGFPIANSTRFLLQGALRDRAGNEGDTIGVRTYRNGDRLRNIHWVQSIRSQTLMVRERQTVASTGATVFLDLSPGDHEGRGINNSFEWTIRIAASICKHLHESDSPVQVVSFGLPELMQTSEDNRNGIRPVMDFLANLPTLAEALKTAEFTDGRQSDSVHAYVNSSCGYLFAIGSDRSEQVRFAGTRERAANITPVVIDSDGFKSDDDLLLLSRAQESLASREDQSNNREAILVETPQSAVEELVCGWNRSFSDAG